jgi:hypothetical protein
MRVKIVLRDRSSGLYYRGERDWVRTGYDAMTFSNIIDAEAFCRAHHLGDLQFIQQQGYIFRRPAAGKDTDGPALENFPNRPL